MVGNEESTLNKGAGARLALRYDLRAPAFGADISALYRACIEQCEAADGWGFERVFLAEHHGSEDRYCPSPVSVAAAVAARTSRLRLSPAAFIAPLHHPLRIAEELAVLDLLSDGRVDVILGAGYVEAEFAMFGADLTQRGAVMSEVIAVLKQAWTGEPFEFRGQRVRVTPRPVQAPRPDIYLGGMSRPAALRAAREADGFWPINPKLTEIYLEERKRLGLPEGVAAPDGYAVDPFRSPRFVLVSEDPERDWERILPHALHETNEYARMLTDAPGASQKNLPAGFTAGALSAQDIRDGGTYMVVTPEECVEMYRPLAKASGMITLHPLLAGLDPELSWSSLTLFAERVMPELTASATPLSARPA
jgi:alkanesulfonate monooxygenase SsuD/methylene tetrahydromethanopterin reductase-like flavin-dependent oxidoreductase (luciferase family)